MRRGDERFERVVATMTPSLPEPGAGDDGFDASARHLTPIVYEELRRIAHRQRRRGGGDSPLTTTALVHEAYLKLMRRPGTTLGNRSHFLAVAALAMRQLLVDDARARLAAKRGGQHSRVDLDADAMATDEQCEALLELDEALSELAQLDGRLARVVNCRFFGGLTEEETAAAVGVTARTVRRDWTKAKALLYARLRT